MKQPNLLTAAAWCLGLLAPAAASAGIKYWDNPDYRVFDVDCYVPGAVWNLDGIRNVGANQPHSDTALTWVNLGSSGADNDVFLRKNTGGSSWATASSDELSAGTYGEWADDGFVFKGNSQMRGSKNIDTGTKYTIQVLVDADSTQHATSFATIFNSNWTKLALLIIPSGNTLVFRTVESFAANSFASIPGPVFEYATAIANSDDNTEVLFSGTEAPTSGDGFRQNTKISGQSESGYAIGCANDGKSPLKGTLKSFRYYKKALTNEEVAWNRVVDERRFFGRVAPLPVTNAVVVSSIAASTEPAGTYAVDGRHVFTAPRVATVGNAKYICTGYTLETWDDTTGDWGSAVFHARELSCAVTDTSRVRIAWKWMDGEGLKTYDVSDYVWSGLVLFYDGICNVGTNLPHSTTTTIWANLGSAGAVNDMFLQLLNAGGTAWTTAAGFDVVDGRDPGAWTVDGFALKGDSRFRCNSASNNKITVGTDYSLQMLLDAKAAEQKDASVFPFSLSASTFSILLYKSGSIKWRNDSDPYANSTDNALYMIGTEFNYLTAIMDSDAKTTAFFGGTEVPTSGTGFREHDTLKGHSEGGYDLGGYGNSNYDQLLTGTIKSFRQYDHALTAAEVAQNRKVDDFRYFGKFAETDVIVQSTYAALQGSEPDGEYDVDGSHTFTAPASVTIKVNGKEIDYACDGYTVETWDGSAWSNATSYESCSYAYNTSAGLVRLTWRWRPTHGLRTAADYSYSDYSQAGLYWHYDGLLNQGVGKARSTDANATWVNLGSAGATYDMTKYLVGSKVDGEWTDDGYLFRGGTRFRVVGKPIGPFKSFSIQVLVDADMDSQAVGKSCYVMSGMWDYFAIALGNNGDAYNGAFYGNFQGLGTGNKHASVYFKNDSGHYDFATGIMDYDARTAQVFGGVEPPASGTGFHQFDSVTSRSDSGFGLGNGGGDGTEGIVGTVKFFRYYDRVLTEEEIVRNRNVDAVRYFGALGVTNLVVEAGGFDAEPAEGAYFVEGSYTFTAAQSAFGPRLAGYKLVDVDPETGAILNSRFVESTTFVYDAATAAPKMKLIWSDCRPFVMVIR